MINSQNFFRTAFGAKTLLETRDQSFDQPWISEKRLQMPLRLHQIVKDQLSSLPCGTELRAGSLAAPFDAVNSVDQKVLFLSHPSHLEQ